MKTQVKKFVIFILLVLQFTNIDAQDISNSTDYNIGGYSNPLNITMTKDGIFQLYRDGSTQIAAGSMQNDNDLFVIKIGSTSYRSSAKTQDFTNEQILFSKIENVSNKVVGRVQTATKRFSASYQSKYPFSVELSIIYDSSNPEIFIEKVVIDASKIPAGTRISYGMGYETYVASCNGGLAFTIPDLGNRNGKVQAPLIYKPGASEISSLKLVGAKNSNNAGSFIGIFTMGRPFSRVYSSRADAKGYGFIVFDNSPALASALKYGPYDMVDCSKHGTANNEWRNVLSYAYDDILAGQVTTINTGFTFTNNLFGDLDYSWTNDWTNKNATINAGATTALHLKYTSHSATTSGVGFKVNFPGLKINGPVTRSGFTNNGMVDDAVGNEYYQVSGAGITNGADINIPLIASQCGQWVVDASSISDMSRVTPLGAPATLTIESEVNFASVAPVSLAAGESQQVTVKLPNGITASEDINAVVTYSGNLGSFSSLPNLVTIQKGQNSASFTLQASGSASNGSSLTVQLQAVTNQYLSVGQNRQFNINVSNCKTDIKNDTVMLMFNNSVDFDILANDKLACDRSLATIDFVPASGLNLGSMTVNSDQTVKYTPNKNQYGIDSVEYQVTCSGGNSGTVCNDKGKIYFIIQRPEATQYSICPNTEITVGMKPIQGLSYNWYNIIGLPLENNSNTITILKDDKPLQIVYAEPNYEGKTGARHTVYMYLNDVCDEGNPVGCVVDGRLLFREDFGGNNTGDPRVSPSGLTSASTDCTLKTVNDDAFYGMGSTGYWLLKYNKNTKGPYNVNTQMWHTDFDDHTSPADTTSGYMMMVDADENTDMVYEKKIGNLCGNMNLYFSARVANLAVLQAQSTGIMDEPVLMFELLDSKDSVLNTCITKSIPFEKDGEFKWKTYGFSYKTLKGTSDLKLRISNYNPNPVSKSFFVIDDIEVRLCLPEITLMPVDTAICPGLPFKFRASYTDDGTFGNDLIYRWEYSSTGAQNSWKLLAEQSVSGSSTINPEYEITSPDNSHAGYYRILVGNAATIGNANCRAESDTAFVTVLSMRKAVDLRLHVAPSTVPENRKINLTSFVDTAGMVGIQWNNYLNLSPDFTDLTAGTLNVSEFSQKTRIYTYKYNLTSHCGTTSAKAYVSVKNEVPRGYGKEIVVCRSHESSSRIQLKHILGFDSEGTWSYPVDNDNAISNNIDQNMIFDAQNAYSDAQNAAYSINYKGDTNAKIFKFRFTSANNNIKGNKTMEFVIIVTSN